MPETGTEKALVLSIMRHMSDESRKQLMEAIADMFCPLCGQVNGGDLAKHMKDVHDFDPMAGFDLPVGGKEH